MAMSNLVREQQRPPALIYVSSRRYIYLGQTQLRIRDLHSAAASLLICLDGSVRFRALGSERWEATRSLLIPAGSRISIDNQGAIFAACYLDAARPDFFLLKSRMRRVSGGIYHDISGESHLVSELLELRDEAPSFDEAQGRMESLIQQGSAGTCCDPRVVHVIERLRDTASLNIPVRALAEEVGLSESGLIRLFGLQVGAPLRRHRLWYRLIDFLHLVLAGVPSTSAIRLSGFTDAAHLSRCYSGFFGVNLSYAFSKNTHVRYIAASSGMAGALPRTRPEMRMQPR